MLEQRVKNPKHHYFDNPVRWIESQTRPVFDIGKFQKQLDEIAGISRGRSIVKLVWIPEWTENIPIEWGALGYPSVYETRPVEWCYSIDDYQKVTYIAPPRWAFLELQSDANTHAVNSDLWAFDPYDEQPVMIGDTNREAVYTLWDYLAPHDTDGFCCKSAKKAGERCYGYYQEPIEFYLNEVKRVVRERERDALIDPTKPMDIEQMLRVQKPVYDKLAVAEKKREEIEEQFWKDEFNTHGFSIISDDPSVKKHGRYHFVKELPAGFKETESGIAVPE